jgi:hypothetical protein
MKKKAQNHDAFEAARQAFFSSEPSATASVRTVAFKRVTPAQTAAAHGASEKEAATTEKNQ